MIENIIIINSSCTKRDIELVFNNEEVQFCTSTTYEQLLKEVGVYPSTTAARKANRVGLVPSGYTEYKASKTRRLFIWNPSEFPDYNHEKIIWEN
jgi:sulfur carrier protein ThiS